MSRSRFRTAAYPAQSGLASRGKEMGFFFGIAAEEVRVTVRVSGEGEIGGAAEEETAGSGHGGNWHPNG